MARRRKHAWVGRKVTMVDCVEPCQLFEVVGEMNRDKVWIALVAGGDPVLVRKRDVQRVMTAAQVRANAPCPGCGNKRSLCTCLEDALLYQCRAVGLPEPVPQYQFEPTRKWRADFAWPDERVLVEVDGGAFRSRHREMAGFERDAEKTNRAAVLGFAVLRFTGRQVKSGEAVTVIETMLRQREEAHSA